MRIPTRSIVTACALMGALLAAGCAGTGVKQTRAGELVLLQAAGERGPDPFTASTDTGSVRAESPRGTARVQPGDVEAPLRATRSLSGATPGLYRGSPRVAGCDVERHVRYLTADAAKADAFARAADVSRAALPGYLRGLTPVVLGADTRVTNHAYRDGAAASRQAVLQSGTSVLVDGRGMPRLRCACGNPLKEPVAQRTTPKLIGRQWSSYRPANVVVVRPAPVVVKVFVIYDTQHREWLNRHRGDVNGRHDQRGKAPKYPNPWTLPPSPTTTPPTSPQTTPPTSPSPTSPTDKSPSPTDKSPSPTDKTPTDKTDSPTDKTPTDKTDSPT
ncbi:DUF6777 domain-containing protein, partial [Streptomyces tricolor]|uniref:DUF6777 domain-containing protein n=1 Tax=Streptomyces tricolor TaxID=68277 RepID=UPI001ABFB471